MRKLVLAVALLGVGCGGPAHPPSGLTLTAPTYTESVSGMSEALLVPMDTPQAVGRGYRDPYAKYCTPRCERGEAVCRPGRHVGIDWYCRPCSEMPVNSQPGCPLTP
jgi:hypothetical protein